jgi:hypothetical protein
MKYAMNIALALASAALAYGSTAGAAAADAATEVADAQPATWTAKELTFTYQGFTTRYSCDGLRGKVRSALLILGARRKDLTVNESGCSRPDGGPEPFPGVRIKMQVLTPVAAAATPDAKTVAAHWKAVDLRLDRDALSESGDCELLEQIKQSILPLFTTRNIKYSSTCVPHQLSPGGTILRADVLVSDAPDAKPGAPAVH